MAMAAIRGPPLQWQRAALIGALLALALSRACSADLVNPFLPDPTFRPCDSATVPKKTYGPPTFYVCPRATAPTYTCPGIKFYLDSAGSRVNETAYAINDALAQNVSDYCSAVDSLTLQYWSSRPLNEDIATCVWSSWLVPYAKANAWLDPASPKQGGVNLVLLYSRVVMGYMRIQNSPVVKNDVANKATVNAWLTKVVAILQRLLVDQWDVNPGRYPNNLGYWTATAAAYTGAATQNVTMYNWGLQVFTWLKNGQNADGTLIEELKRGKKACPYHANALQPVTFTALLALANGRNEFVGTATTPLLKLFRVALNCWYDPAYLDAQIRQISGNNKLTGQALSHPLHVAEIFHRYLGALSNRQIKAHIIEERPFVETASQWYTETTWIWGIDVASSVYPGDARGVCWKTRPPPPPAPKNRPSPPKPPKHPPCPPGSTTCGLSQRPSFPPPPRRKKHRRPRPPAPPPAPPAPPPKRHLKRRRPRPPPPPASDFYP